MDADRQRDASTWRQRRGDAPDQPHVGQTVPSLIDGGGDGIRINVDVHPKVVVDRHRSLILDHQGYIVAGGEDALHDQVGRCLGRRVSVKDQRQIYRRRGNFNVIASGPTVLALPASSIASTQS